MRAVFDAQGEAFAREFARHSPVIDLANPSTAQGALDGLWAAVTEQTDASFRLGISAALGASLNVGAHRVLRDLGATVEQTSEAVVWNPIFYPEQTVDFATGKTIAVLDGTPFDLPHPKAVQWVDQHGARLVRNVNDETRDIIRLITRTGIEHGDSSERIGRDIRTRFSQMGVPKPQLHIDNRAHGIAVTEMAFGYEQGQRATMDELAAAGLAVVKSWLTAGDERVEDRCTSNAGAGEVALQDDFPDGSAQPPAHPYCRCTAEYRTLSRAERLTHPLRDRFPPLPPPVTVPVRPPTIQPTPTRVPRVPVEGDVSPTRAQYKTAKEWEARVAAEEHAANPRPGYGGRFGMERGAVIDRDGRILWDGSGSAASMDMASPEIRAIMKPGNLVTHFHPSTDELVRLSNADIRYAMDERITIRAFHSRGQVQQFTPKPGAVWRSPHARFTFDDDMAAWKAAHPTRNWDDAFNATMKEYTDGKGTFTRVPAKFKPLTASDPLPTPPPPKPPVPDPVVSRRWDTATREETVEGAGHSLERMQEVFKQRYGTTVGVEQDLLSDVIRNPSVTREMRVQMTEAFEHYRDRGVPMQGLVRDIRFMLDDIEHPLQKGGLVPADMDFGSRLMRVFPSSRNLTGRTTGYGIYEGFDGFQSLIEHELGHAFQGRWFESVTRKMSVIHDATKNAATTDQIVAQLARAKMYREESLHILDVATNPNVLADHRALIKSYDNIIASSEKALKVAAEAFPSRYGSNNLYEDFAESVWRYLNTPEELKRLSPKRYKLIKGLIP